jgi:hypothetical protein
MKFLKNKALLYGVIGLNLGLFGLGYFLTDISLMIISLMSMALCYIGTTRLE